MYADLMERTKLRVVFNRIRKHPGIRFSELVVRSGMHAPEVSSALTELKENALVWTTSIPTKGKRVFFAYELSPKGKKAALFLEKMMERANKFKGDDEAQDVARRLDMTQV